MFVSGPTLAQSQTLETRIGPIELQSGYPSEASVKKLYDELDFQRAVQAYIWATPLVASEAQLAAYLRDIGVGFNTVTVFDKYTTPELKILTANNTTIYASVFMDLGRDGPVILESPEGVYGVVDDFWQRPVVEVGPFGPDKGKGGKFLLIPPDYKGAVPTGYFPANAQANRLVLVSRAFVKEGNIEAAAAALERLRVYPLSQAADPPRTSIVRMGGRAMDTIAPRGFGYWEILANALQHEPVEPHDRFFHAMLKPLGIELGKPFNPDARQKQISLMRRWSASAWPRSSAPRHAWQTRAAIPARNGSGC